jgi:DNA-binding response OmpR family regulator/nitrogen-specific signal transduction histidine kinase
VRHRRVMLARQRALEAVVAQRTEELRRSNAQLAEQAERLTEVDRLKTRFFINVGHEFRTPLTLVLGPIDDLLRDTRERFSVRAREQLEMANRNARRVLDLIVELLDVNRFEHGQVRMTRVPADLRTLAQRVLLDHAPLLERYGHGSVFNVASDGPWLAAVDAAQLERALSNLIGNAGKYMARGGMIELRLRRVDAAIELALIDQGRGISAAAVPHVFDRFFQAEGADSASGYGIGLALVREILEAHQGLASVESEVGVGSTFRLTLPALAAHAGGVAPDAALPERRIVAPEAEADEGAPRGRALVLVVDDHDDLRARVRGLLEDRFDVIEATDGPAAWKLGRDCQPDLIVCDVMMPGFDGTELTRRLRADADTAAIAVLLLTAKVGSEHAVEGLHAGADDYLAKPFDASELLARIDALLARAQRLRQRLARERLPPPAAAATESVDARWRRRLDELVAQRLDDPELSVEQLAEGMHSDRSQLFRKCKELLGSSPSEYLRDVRLKRAHELLLERVGSISEVAYAVGFDSLSSFTRAFKARYALPPSRVAAREAG